MVQEGRDGLGILRQLQRQNAGAIDLDLCALNGIVIDKDEALQPEIELAPEGLEVFRLAAPIEPPRYEMLVPEHHIGSLLKHVQNITFVVFAAEAKQPPGARLPDHELLQRFVRWCDLDAQGAVLAADPLPKCVVAVQHNYFVGILFQTRHHAEH